MKFIECPKLLALTNELSGANLGDRVIHGRIESYTCKTVKAEKQLSKEIEKQLVVETSTSPGGPNKATPSPLGPLNSSSTRKLLVNLITTMNASFPDYDFSNLRPEQFEHETNRFFVQNSINNVLLNGMEHIQPGFREQCWKTIDETIELDKCEIYNYSPDLDSDLGVGKLWSFNYFFFNKKKKTLVLFAAHALSKLRGPKATAAVGDDDDADVDMDDENDGSDDGDDGIDWDDLNMESGAAQAPTKLSSSVPKSVSLSTGPSPSSMPASPFVSGMTFGTSSSSSSAFPTALMLGPTQPHHPQMAAQQKARDSRAMSATTPMLTSTAAPRMATGMMVPQQSPVQTALPAPAHGSTPLFSLGGVRTGSNANAAAAAAVAAVAAQQQRDQKAPIPAARTASMRMIGTPTASPAASPLIRPTQPLPAAAAGAMGAARPSITGAPTAANGQRSASMLTANVGASSAAANSANGVHAMTIGSPTILSMTRQKSAPSTTTPLPSSALGNSYGAAAKAAAAPSSSSAFPAQTQTHTPHLLMLHKQHPHHAAYHHAPSQPIAMMGAPSAARPIAVPYATVKK